VEGGGFGGGVKVVAEGVGGEWRVGLWGGGLGGFRGVGGGDRGGIWEG